MGQSDVLVINCGSSSIKFALVDPDSGNRPLSGIAERLGHGNARIVWKSGSTSGTVAIPNADHDLALEALVSLPAAQDVLKEPPIAVGHRVVHGGEQFSASVVVDDQVLAAIETCSALAPLHNPANIVGIKGCNVLFPDIPQVAVFDTAFHQSIAPHAYMYAVPYEWYRDSGVRRYGFHGTSHRFVTMRAAQVLGLAYSRSSFISAHLGNGCSATAVRDGKSVDTTMGLTPLEGLMMGTRSGNVDPALHEFMAQNSGMSLEQVTDVLNKQSGLLGISGVSNDMRAISAAAAEGNDRASLAIEMFCYRLAKGIASLSAALDRIDALIFTGGIGENNASIRARCVEYLTLLDLRIDEQRNIEHGRTSRGIISQPETNVILVVPTDEEWMIAQDCVRLVVTR